MMKLEIQGKVISDAPQPEDVTSALKSLDGFRRDWLVLYRANGEALKLVRERGERYLVIFEKTVDDVTESRQSKRKLTFKQALQGAHAYLDNRSDWPPLMRWTKEYDVTKEAKQQDMRDLKRQWRETPLKVIGVSLSIIAAETLFLIFMDYFGRGLSTILFGKPSLPELIITNLITIIVINLFMLLYLVEDAE